MKKTSSQKGILKWDKKDTVCVSHETDAGY